MAALNVPGMSHTLMQAVRDEILNIMHRNNIGEKRGTWMEDWHQKLHNNTTPDDVAICEAYIAFLKAGGDKGAYWSVLSDAGKPHSSQRCHTRQAIDISAKPYDALGILLAFVTAWAA